MGCGNPVKPHIVVIVLGYSLSPKHPVMNTLEITPEEQKNRRRSMLISVGIHLLILILAILPFLKYPDPPPGQEGVLISFGEPDVGQGDDRPDVQQETPDVQPTKSEAARPAEAPAKSTPEKIVTSNDADTRLKRQQQEAESRQRVQQQQAAAEEAARKKAAEEASRKAAEEEARKKAEYDQTKKQYGDFFGGKGKGDTGKPGNQGDPKGDPDASKLDGLTKGSGVIGAGLSNRGVRKAPDISDRSQKTGRVVVYVCVDRNGKVLKAEYTQRGSTTSDAQLIDLAIRNARSYLFTESDLDEQCGTITYDFKVQ
jgi:predicted nucleic acid-binding Zn ribbon protein